MYAMIELRILAPEDAVVFQGLRLRALLENPEAFGASYEEDKDTPIDKVAERIRTTLPDSPTFGAFLDGMLVGMVGIARSPRKKQHHRALIWGMYVTPEARGKGIGKQLLTTAIDHARQAGVEELTLAVTVGNLSARKLYVSSGFNPYGVEPRYFKVDGRYYDLEWMWLRL
jgi:ribosomal protein S18 acetylase RimI-like enzyme